MGKLPGIGLILSILGLVTVSGMIYSNRPNPPSGYIQLAIALLSLSLALAGCYLVRNYCPSTKKMAKIQIYVLGCILAVFGILVSFNIVNFLSGFNWVIAIGIAFIMLVQLQLLNWGDKTGSIVKISSVSLMLADLFLVVFFITKWGSSNMGLWLNVAISVSLLSFGVGMAFLPGRSRKKMAEEQMNT